MKEILFSLPGVALTVLCWGAYGSVLHKGQHDLGGSRLKPLICVGISYFVVAIIVPVVILAVNGKLSGDWQFKGIAFSLAAGVAGAFGAFGIVLALTAGGKPTYVMPLVFGCAPIVNVFVSMYFAKISWKELSPIFIAGLILVSVGAATVLISAPKPAKKPADKGSEQKAKVDPAKDEESASTNGDSDQAADSEKEVSEPKKEA
jgi:hypothetical protein